MHTSNAFGVWAIYLYKYTTKSIIQRTYNKNNFISLRWEYMAEDSMQYFKNTRRLCMKGKVWVYIKGELRFWITANFKMLLTYKCRLGTYLPIKLIVWIILSGAKINVFEMFGLIKYLDGEMRIFRLISEIGLENLDSVTEIISNPFFCCFFLYINYKVMYIVQELTPS